MSWSETLDRAKLIESMRAYRTDGHPSIGSPEHLRQLQILIAQFMHKYKCDDDFGLNLCLESLTWHYSTLTTPVHPPAEPGSQ